MPSKLLITNEKKYVDDRTIQKDLMPLEYLKPEDFEAQQSKKRFKDWVSAQSKKENWIVTGHRADILTINPK